MTTLPNPFFAENEKPVPTFEPAPQKSAPVLARSPSPVESRPSPDVAGADTRFHLNVQAFTYAIDQRSVDWDPLPSFIADPSPEYLALIQRAAE